LSRQLRSIVAESTGNAVSDGAAGAAVQVVFDGAASPPAFRATTR
jgi:hypothetical protein